MKEQRYVEADERKYYQGAPEDRRAVPYDHLDVYAAAFGADIFRGKRVLDIGAGEGVYSAWIASRGGASEVVGIELIEHRIRRDYEKLLPNLSFRAGSIFDKEAPEGQFDVAFMNLVLHHLRFRLDDTLEFVCRSLKPGGAFLAVEPNVYSPWALLAHMIHDRSANEGFLAPWQVRRVLKRHDFTDVRVGYFWRSRRWARNPLLGSSFWIAGTAPV